MSSNELTSHEAAVPSEAASVDTAQYNENDAATSTEVGSVTAPSTTSPCDAISTILVENYPSDDDENAPVPPAQFYTGYNEMDMAIKESIKYNISNNEDDDAPLPPSHMAAAFDDAIRNNTENMEEGPEMMEENGCPIPAGQNQQDSEFDEEMGVVDYAKRKSSQGDNEDASKQVDEEDTAIVSLVLEQTEHLSQSHSNQNESGRNTSSIDQSPVVIEVTPPPQSVSSPPNEPSSASVTIRSSPPASVAMFEVPEATLVADQEVYEAEFVRLSDTIETDSLSTTASTATSPRWKRQHQRCLLIGLLAIIVAVSASVTTGIVISYKDPPSELTTQMISNTTTPSMAPTECSLRISRQAQIQELQEYQMLSPVFAIDGANGILATGSGFVIFFLLSGNTMIIKNLFEYESLGSRPSVAISGNVAVVGNPHDNVAYIYDNVGGIWEKQGTLTPRDGDSRTSYFGASVDVHGNTIVVGAPMYNVIKGSIFVFLRSEDRSWQLQEKIHPESLCERALFGLHVAIHGTTVVAGAACRQSIYIYHLDKKSGNITFLQDPFADVFVDKSHLTNVLYLALSNFGLPSAINLSSDNYLFLTNATGIIVYQQPSSVEPFTFVQYIEVENFGNTYTEYDYLGDPLGDIDMYDMSEDIISDYGDGYLFSPVVDKDLFAFAGGNVLYIFSRRGRFWEEAMQIESHNYAEENSNATLFKGTIAISGRNLMFVSENGISTYDLEGCTQITPTISPTSISPSLHQNSSALLTVPPSTSPPSPHPTISLKPTAVPSFSTHPTSSLVPTTVPSNSQEPSSSAAPTKCYAVEIIILTDTQPKATSWNITMVNEDVAVSNNNELGTAVATSPDYSGDGATEYEHHICLEEGLYEFAIYDSDGNGMCCMIVSGYYKVQIAGETIVEGGEFGYKETTIFTLPYIPTSTAYPTPTARPMLEASTPFGSTNSTSPPQIRCWISEDGNGGQEVGLSMLIADIDGYNHDREYVCVSLCFDCSAYTGVDTMLGITCTDEQRASGTKLSRNTAIPLESLDSYTKAYSNSEFKTCKADDCNKADACARAPSRPTHAPIATRGPALTTTAMPTKTVSLLNGMPSLSMTSSEMPSPSPETTAWPSVPVPLADSITNDINDVPSYLPNSSSSSSPERENETMVNGTANVTWLPPFPASGTNSYSLPSNLFPSSSPSSSFVSIPRNKKTMAVPETAGNATWSAPDTNSSSLSSSSLMPSPSFSSSLMLTPALDATSGVTDIDAKVVLKRQRLRKVPNTSHEITSDSTN